MSDMHHDQSLPSVAEVRVRELAAAIEALVAVTPEEGSHAAD